MTRIEKIEKRIKELDDILEKRQKEWWSMKDKNTTFSTFTGSWEEYCKYREPEISEVIVLEREKRMLMTPQLSEPMKSDLDGKVIGDLFTIKEFIENCEDGGFIDYDGSGNYAKEVNGKMMESNISIFPSDIKNKSIRVDFTHVLWYNR
jgi:hypothetical protein